MTYPTDYCEWCGALNTCTCEPKHRPEQPPTEETEHWCPIHGKHGEWSPGDGVSQRCWVQVKPDWQCGELPIAPDVVEAIRAEGRAEERAAVLDAIDNPPGYVGKGSPLDRHKADLAAHIREGRHADGINFEARIRADQHRKTLEQAAAVADSECQASEAAASRCKGDRHQRMLMEERALAAARIADDIRALAQEGPKP